MRNFSKKLAFVLAAAMVFTAFAPAAKADAAEKMVMNRASQTLYVNEGVNDKGAETLPEGLYGNVQEYDFYVKNKPANYAKELKFAWESSDEKVATVDNKGLTKAVAVGTATITCTITDKATGDEVAEATAKVTVKANAADVVITNAEDYDNLPVPEDGVVDLNRAMYDENDNKTTKRGKVVTDYTRWIAEDADGEAVDATVVAIDQATGKFTFAADAPAGDYALYCQTYQSDKYNQTTAESEKVTVSVVVDKTFDVVQTTTTKFVVKFNTPVKSLSVADVSVSRMLGNYPYVQTVKSAKLAEDKMSAEVEIFNTFADKVNYTIKVKDFEEYTLTASNGKPVRMDVIAVDGNGNPKNPPMVIFTNEATELSCVFYDAANVQVNSTEKVRFTLDKSASTKDCYLNGSKLTIKKDTASAVVVASFPGWIENGKRVGDFTQTQAFYAENKAEVFPASVTQFTLDNGKWWGKNVHSFQMKENPGLYVMLSQSDWQNANEVYGANNMAKIFKGDLNKKSTITFDALNPDVAVISSTGKLTGFKPGFASFYVNYNRYDATTKKYEEIPFATVEVEVLADSKLADVTGTASSLKVGTHVDYDDTSLFMLGSDQYGARYDVDTVTASSSNFTIECLSEGYGDQKALAAIVRKACATAAYGNDGQGKNGIKININANDLRAQLIEDGAMNFVLNKNDEKVPVENGEFVDLEFRATYAHQGWDKKSVEFTVCIQEPSSDDYTIENNDNIVEVVTSADSKDVLRRNEWNQKDRKSVDYDIKIMNNDVQVGVVDVSKYNAEVKSENDYQVKILKNGEDVTNNGNIIVSGSKITVYPSYTDKLSDRAQKAVSGGAVQYVKYDGLGEGVYTLELYKWNKDGNGDWIDSLENTADISITVSDAGTYSLDIENQRKNKVKVNDATGDEYNTTDAEKILYCFNFTNRDNGNVIKSWADAIEDNQKFTKFFVDYYAPANSDFVYVKEVVFYEPVDGAWAAYVVPVDISLVRE